MAEVASAYVSLLPSAKGFGRATESQVGGEMKSSGSRIGALLGKSMKAGLLAAGGVSLAAGAFLKGAIDTASDVTESQSKVGVVFGKSAAQIIKASKTSATAMGLSKGAYLDATGTLGNLLVSLDLAPKKAAGMSQQMVKLAGDLASFNNVSPTEALDALRSGLTGETEPLKRFGVNMNDATLKAQALKMGLIKSTKDALNPQSKALAAQALIMDQTKTAQGDFARTSGGLANQQRILSAQFDNLKATVGSALYPVVTKFINFLTGTAMPGVKSFIAGIQNGEGIGGRFASAFETVSGAVRSFVADFQAGVGVGGQVASALQGVIGVLADLGGWMLKNKAVVGTFVGILLTVVAVVKVWTITQTILNAVLTANPIGIVVVALAALAAGLVYAYKHSETFRNVVNAVFGAVKSVVGAVVGWFGKYVPKVFDTVVSAVRTYVNVYKTVVTTAFAVVKKVVTTYMSAVRSVVSAVMGAIKSVVSTDIAAVKAAFNGIAALVGRVRGWFGSILGAIKGKLGEAITFVKSVPGKMIDGLGAVSSLLYSAGVDMMRGFINGVRSMAGELANVAIDAARGAVDGVKGFLHIHSPSKVMHKIGGFTMQGLVNGIVAGTPAAIHAAEGAAKKVQAVVLGRLNDMRDQAKKTVDSLKSAFTSLKGSMAQAFSGDLFNASGLGDFLVKSSVQKATLQRLIKAFKTLNKWGLPSSFLSQLFASGNSELILEMAGSKSAAQQSAALFGQVTSLQNQLGTAVARDSLGPRIDRANHHLERIEKALDRLPRNFGHEINHAGRHGQRKGGKG